VVGTAVSDGTGQYRVENLTPGTYKITYSLPGFTTIERERDPEPALRALQRDVGFLVGYLVESTVPGWASSSPRSPEASMLLSRCRDPVYSSTRNTSPALLNVTSEPFGRKRRIPPKPSYWFWAEGAWSQVRESTRRSRTSSRTPAVAGARPVRSPILTLGSGNERIELYHLGLRTPAATPTCSSRSIASSTRATRSQQGVPIADTNNGGSVVAFPDTLTKAAAIPNVDTIITGHSSLMTPADMKECIDFTRTFREGHAVGAKKAGRSVDDVASTWASNGFAQLVVADTLSARPVR
jgi:hypothetical protein